MPGTPPRADQQRLIEFTGERCVPWVTDAAMVYEHFHRYLWAARLVRGRRVLDLGSGEGFGGAILARVAAEVQGIDVDADAVDHAAANYARAGLSFEQGSALDLSRFEPGSFGAVVAFEMIEHVGDHQTLMNEIERVLAADGLLVISTPDKDLYSDASGRQNSYHEHELTRSEFQDLLAGRFAHVQMWGQRTITGSFLSALAEGPDAETPGGQPGPRVDFFLDSEGGWHETAEPQALFCVAVASRVALPAIAPASTLSDYGLELLHETERAHAVAVAERDRLLGELNEEKRREVLEVGARLAGVEARLLETGEELRGVSEQLLGKGDELWRLEVELDEARTSLRRIEESTAWQSLQRAKDLLYGAIGQESRLARALKAAGRLLARVLASGR